MEDEPNRPDTPDMPEEDTDSSSDQGQQSQSQQGPSSRSLKPRGVSQGPLPSVGVPGGSAIPSVGIPGAGGTTQTAATVVQGASRIGGIIGFFSTPPGWITLAFLILLIILLFIFLVLMKQDLAGVTVTLTKTGPTEVKNPVSPADDPANEFEYTLNVAYTGNPSSITVTDYLPEGVEYVEGSASASGGMYNASTHTVTWSLSGGGGGTTGVSGPSNLDTFNQSYFSGLGFPTPQDGAKTLSAEGLKRWDEGAGAAVLKAAGIVGIDPGIVGAWSFFEGINYDMKVDNCQDSEYDLNTPCASNNWQVGGPGVRPGEQIGVLAEAFEKMYGSSDASTVQKVGQAVYAKIGRSGTFPSKSAATLASDFRNGGAARDQVGDLMRDYSIGAYVLATIFKEMGNNVAGTMEGWSAQYYNRQDYINTIKALYDAR